MTTKIRSRNEIRYLLAVDRKLLSAKEMFFSTKSKCLIDLPNKKNINDNIKNVNNLIRNCFKTTKEIDDSYYYTIRQKFGPNLEKLLEKYQRTKESSILKKFFIFSLTSLEYAQEFIRDFDIQQTNKQQIYTIIEFLSNMFESN